MNNNKESKKATNRLPVFYIALCCCVLAIGVAGYISQSLTTSKTSTVADNVEITTPRPVYTTAPIATIEPTEAVAVFNNEFQPEVLDIPTAPPEEETEYIAEVITEDYTFDNPDIVAVNADAHVFEGAILPIEGDILCPFSDTPHYNEAYGDWRTHNGIDIASEEGAEVVAAANGEVKSIVPTVCGMEVTISHSDGYETVYSQLIPTDTLNEGNNVRCGDIIGTVTTAKGEAVTEPHLHFEVKLDGKYINPYDYVSE